MTKPFTAPALALSLAAAMGCTVVAQTTQAPQTAPLACSLTLTPQNGQTLIEGLVQPAEALTGTYTLSVARRGSGGQSVINQGGPFAAPAGEVTRLGRVALGGTPDQVDATFELTTSAGRYACPLQTL